MHGGNVDEADRLKGGSVIVIFLSTTNFSRGRISTSRDSRLQTVTIFPRPLLLDNCPFHDRLNHT